MVPRVRRVLGSGCGKGRRLCCRIVLARAQRRGFGPHGRAARMQGRAVRTAHDQARIAHDQPGAPDHYKLVRLCAPGGAHGVRRRCSRRSKLVVPAAPPYGACATAWRVLCGAKHCKLVRLCAPGGAHGLAPPCGSECDAGSSHRVWQSSHCPSNGAWRRSATSALPKAKHS